MKKSLLTLAAVLGMVVSANAEGTGKFLSLTQNEAKANSWDSQVSISLEGLTVGQPVKISFEVKSTVDFTDDCGTETIDARQSQYKDTWGNSAVFNYTSAFKPTTEWQTVYIEFAGKTDVNYVVKDDSGNKTDEGTVKDFEYAPTAIIINWGKAPQGATLSIDNVKVVDADGKEVYVQDFEKVSDADVKQYDANAAVYYPGYHSHITVAIGEASSALPTIFNDAEVISNEYYNVRGQKVEAPVRGVNIVKQTLSNGEVRTLKTVVR